MKEINFNDIELTAEDWQRYHWKNAIIGVENFSYIEYWHAFEEAVKCLEEKSDVQHKKLLIFLTHLCSLQLCPDNIQEPYSAIVNWHSCRSLLPSDLNEKHWEFLASIAEIVDDTLLQARIADLLWMYRKPKNIKHCLLAIDAYLKFPLDTNEKEWERAIRLMLSIRNNASERLDNTKRYLFSILEGAELSSCHDIPNISKLIYLIISLLTEAQISLIVNKLKSHGDELFKVKRYPYARVFYSETINWYSKLKNIDFEKTQVMLKIAESWVLEADFIENSFQKSKKIEAAITAYLEIPKKEREPFNIDNEVGRLRKQLKEVNKITLANMNIIQSTPIDISEIQSKTIAHVKGKEKRHILRDLVGVPLSNIQSLRKCAIEAILASPTSSIISHSYLASDGRIAARHSKFDLYNLQSKGSQEVIIEKMRTHHYIKIELAVQSYILPIMQVFLAEHTLTQDELIEVCRLSHIVPDGREILWAKGLFFGFQGDFLVSTHLLIPQIEHYVRLVMQAKGKKTSTQDPATMVETENGLGTLLRDCDEEILSEDLIFTFKTLLTENPGLNLRNDVAHGLAEVATLTSYRVIYVWWLCLKLVYESIMKQATEEDMVEEESQSTV